MERRIRLPWISVQRRAGKTREHSQIYTPGIADFEERIVKYLPARLRLLDADLSQAEVLVGDVEPSESDVGTTVGLAALKAPLLRDQFECGKGDPRKKDGTYVRSAARTARAYLGWMAW